MVSVIYRPRDNGVGQPKRFALAFSVVRVVLGLVLLAAACLKVYGLAFGSVSQGSFISTYRLQIAAIEIETFVGLWLVSGWFVAGARMAAALLFGLMTVISLSLALTGQRTCGCLGAMTISPWFAFFFDVAAFSLLIITRPPAPGLQHWRSWLPGFAKTGAGAFVFFALICGIFFLICKNPVATLARLRGDLITIEPDLTEIGDGIEDEVRDVTVRVDNHTSAPSNF